MPLSDISVVNITLGTGGLSQTGFGTGMILGYPTGWVERSRTYTSITGVAADWGVGTPEYKAANAYFSQNPRPEQLVIGRGALKPTMVFKLTVASVLDSQKYAAVFNGTKYEVTSDASATNDEIIILLQAALAAPATAAGFTAAIGGAGPSTFLTLTGNAAGNWASFYPTDPALLTLQQTTANPGIATDLDAIVVENDNWYGLITLYNSSACVLAAAAWAESKLKVYGVQVQDSECATVAAGIATDISKALQAYFRTFDGYHPDNGQFLDAAWFGRCLPYTPGSETWFGKTLAGVSAMSTTPPYKMTATYQTNLTAKNANFYYTIAGRNITAPGKVAAGEWIDTIRGRDWLQVRIQEAVALVTMNADKIPYTDPGIGRIDNEVRAVLARAVTNGFLASYKVTVPTAASQAPVDKAARILRGYSFVAPIQGAIHLTYITGTLTN